MLGTDIIQAGLTHIVAALLTYPRSQLLVVEALGADATAQRPNHLMIDILLRLSNTNLSNAISQK